MTTRPKTSRVTRAATHDPDHHVDILCGDGEIRTVLYTPEEVYNLSRREREKQAIELLVDQHAPVTVVPHIPEGMPKTERHKILKKMTDNKIRYQYSSEEIS